MRHGNVNRKFGRVRKVRAGLLKSLAVALISEGKIKTTDAKAREIRPYVEKIVTSGKSGTPAAHRLLSAKIGKVGADKVLKELSPKYASRSGGYLRITKLPRRQSDGSFMAIVEFV